MDIAKFLVKVADKLDAHNAEESSMAANAIDFAISDSAGTVETLAAITNFATILDCDGHEKAAEILDQVLKTAAAKTKAPYADLYDSKAHNEQTLYNALKDATIEVKEPHLEGWKGGDHPLLTRYSPDYPGVMLLRIADGIYQDMLSKKVYDFKNGFVTENGTRYYGGSVANQTPNAQNGARQPMLADSQGLKTRPQ
jgi:hypothetical protein